MEYIIMVCRLLEEFHKKRTDYLQWVRPSAFHELLEVLPKSVSLYYKGEELFAGLEGIGEWEVFGSKFIPKNPVLKKTGNIPAGLQTCRCRGDISSVVTYKNEYGIEFWKELNLFSERLFLQLLWVPEPKVLTWRENIPREED